jgi:hypothetical protein
MPGRILGVQSQQARNVYKVLERHLDCESSAVFGDSVHLVCRDLENAREKARVALVRPVLPMPDCRRGPSLEDVFVSLMGNRMEFREPRGGVFPPGKRGERGRFSTLLIP